jgi:DNA-binding LacI/PurR family transcriptional regulator
LAPEPETLPESPAGRKRVSIREVARASGVAVSTVSRSLNDDPEVSEATREKVRAAALALGYRPSAAARGLARGRSGNVAVAITAPHTPVFLDPFYAEVLGGIEEVLEARDLHLLITSLKRGHDLVSLVNEGRADGLIVIGCELEEERLREIQALSPLVLVDRELPGFTSVSTDNRAGMARATRELIERGRRHLAFLTDDVSNPNFRARLEGFQDAIAAAGLDALAAPVQSVSPQEGGGDEGARRLLATGRPIDGIVGANDTTAVGAIRTLRAAGLRGPDDVAVIGFDGLAYATGPDWGLATMWVDKARMGREAARLLLEAIDEPAASPGRSLVVTTEWRPGRSI